MAYSNADEFYEGDPSVNVSGMGYSLKKNDTEVSFLSVRRY